MDNIQLGVEAGLSLLLIVTIFYCWYLGRALKVLRRDRHEIMGLITALQNASMQAENGIEHLRQATEIAGRQLGRTMEHARKLSVDMTGFVEKRDNDEIVHGSNENQGMTRPFSADGRSHAEHELLRALRAQKAR